MLNCDSTCNQSLGESQLPGLRIRLDCAWANSQEFRSHYFFPKSSTPPAQTHPSLGHGSLLRGQGVCTLRKEASAGDASTRGPEYLVTSPWSPRPEGQATIFWVHSGFWSQPGKTRQNRFKRCLMKGTLLAPVQPWDSTPPRFQGSDTIPNYGGQWA